MSEAGQTTVPQPRDWNRAGFSLVFLILFYIGQTVFTALGIVQLIWFLAYRAPNPALQKFGPSLGQWLKEVISYISHETENRPFPWAPWPADAKTAA